MSASNGLLYKQKKVHNSRNKRTKSKGIDPIAAFNVFSRVELKSVTNSKTSSQISKADKLKSKESDQDDDFLPKSQITRNSSSKKRKTKSSTLCQTTPEKVPCLSNQNQEPSTSKTNNILVTPKKIPCHSNKGKNISPKTSNSTILKPCTEIRLNSPKKNSPKSAQTEPKIKIISSTVIKKSKTELNKAKKMPVCRNIFRTEENTQTNKNNTILKDYDVNIKIDDKILKGKINISDEKKVICIDITDQNDQSMETEESTCSELETPKKLIQTNAEKNSKILETPTKSRKKIKPKDTKKYTQSSLHNFIGSAAPVPNKNLEINKNQSKNTIKTNSRYTEETNTRVYENVLNILKWVFDKEYFKILFTKSETDALENFFKLPDTKLTILCLRLFTRQHKWYNLTNLCTELNLRDESYNYRDVLTHLNEHYVYSDYTGEKVDILLEHLATVDLKDICNSFKITPPARKEAMLRKLLDYTSKQCTLTFVKNSDQILRERIEEKLGICVKLKTQFKHILYRIHLLYSLTHPDLKTINDIYNLINRVKSNIIKYPNVQTDSTKIFENRQDFLNYAEASLLRKEYEDQFFKKDIGSQYLLCVEAHTRFIRLLNNEQQLEYDTAKPLFLRRFSASWIYCKVLSNGSLNLGKHYSDKVCEWLTDMLQQETYCLYKRGHWYIQLSLINQSHLKKFVEAADNIIAGINDKDVTEVTKYELSIRGSKIRKNKLPQLKFDDLQYALLPNITVPVERSFEAKSVISHEQGRKLHFERITDEGKEYGSVEETAIYYYKENYGYTHGYHCEGRLLTTLFTIFFWDILYEMNVPNTFINEMQSFPLDLFSTDFYTNREDKIKSRLNDILNVWNLKELCEFFSSKFNVYSLEINSVVSFECDNENIFFEIIRCIGKKVLAAVFERLAKDYKQFHSGLPDLFLFNNKEFKCAFVEVKSENDILSTRQILWINYLHEVNACVEVCHVLNKGSKKLKKKVCAE